MNKTMTAFVKEITILIKGNTRSTVGDKKTIQSHCDVMVSSYLGHSKTTAALILFREPILILINEQLLQKALRVMSAE